MSLGGQSMSSRYDAYVLGNTSEEYQRLRHQALAWEEATRRALTKVGVKQGAHCLDVGCGPGEVMRLLREFTGPGGRIVGVDRDGQVGTQALAALTAVYGDGFAFHQHDLATDIPIPEAPYDTIFARFVFFHQRDQVGLLRRLWSATKPGGALLVMDADVLTPFSDWPAWSHEIRDFVQATFRGVGLDLTTGRRMPERFVESGIGPADGLDASTLLFPGPAVAAFAITAARSILPAALAIGTITQDKFDAMVRATEAGGAEEKSMMYWPIVVATWKRKPA